MAAYNFSRSFLSRASVAIALRSGDEAGLVLKYEGKADAGLGAADEGGGEGSMVFFFFTENPRLVSRVYVQTLVFWV